MNRLHRPRISLIAAMAKNRVIGRENRLPWHLPEDLQHFKKLTLGKPVVMGRKTFESIGKPLPGRANLVLTRDPMSWKAPEGVKVFSSFDHALAWINAEHQKAEEVMVVGGGEIYRQALPLADRIYLTVIEREYAGDAFFPEIPEEEFRATESQEIAGDPPFRYVTLDRI